MTVSRRLALEDIQAIQAASRTGFEAARAEILNAVETRLAQGVSLARLEALRLAVQLRGNLATDAEVVKTAAAFETFLTGEPIAPPAQA